MTLDQCVSACVQMIFQCLPFQSKLILGRCSKRLIQERDATHSWNNSTSEPLPCFNNDLAFMDGFSKSCQIFKTSIPLQLILTPSSISPESPSSISPEFQDAFRNAKVEEIILSYFILEGGCEYDDSCVNFLVNKIITTARTVKLPTVCLRTDQMLTIIQACKQSPTLKSFGIQFDYKLDNEVAHSVCDLISKGQLTKIDVNADTSNLSISPEWLQMLCNAIRKNQNLTEFNFRHFDLDGERCKTLLDAVITCPNMENLGLVLNNSMEDSSIKICTEDRFISLHTSGNQYTDIGLMQIARMISRPGNNLLMINIEFRSDITDISTLALVDAMKSNHCCIEFIEINGSGNFTDETKKSIVDIAKLKGIEIDIK